MVAYKGAEFWMRVTLAILAGALFLTVHAVYWPVVISLILTFILMPIRDGVIKGLRRLTGRHVPIDLAILISFVILIVIVTIITNIIVKPLVIQVNLLAANFNDLVSQTAALVTQLENEQTQFYIPDQVKKIVNDTFVKIGNYGIEGITNLIQSVFAIAGTVVEFFVVPIITFYFMKDGGHMVKIFVDIFPESYRSHLAGLFQEIQHVLSRYIRGQILMSCIIATLTFLGMWAMGVPYPMVIGLLAAITEWIPIVGPIVGAVPAILLSATVSLSLPLKVIIFYIVIQQIDSHLIMPQVMGAVISLHPVVIVIALLIGGLIAALMAYLIGLPVLRLKSDYLAIATLGFAEIIRVVIVNATSITNGSLGIKGIPGEATLLTCYIWTVITLVVLSRLIFSNFGNVLRCIRDNEIAAGVMGINVFRYKVLSFCVGAFFAGVGGALLGSHLSTIDPKMFNFLLTFNVLMFVVAGGLGSLTGSLLGATIVTILLEWLRAIEEPMDFGVFEIPGIPGMRMVVFSLILLAIILFRREGIMGTREITWKTIFSLGRRKA